MLWQWSDNRSYIGGICKLNCIHLDCMLKSALCSLLMSRWCHSQYWSSTAALIAAWQHCHTNCRVYKQDTLTGGQVTHVSCYVIVNTDRVPG